MPKTVYKIEQLPSSNDEDRVEWSIDDYNIWIEKTENNKMRLKGEFLEWNAEEEDWGGTLISRNECIDIAEQYDLILPTTEGMKKLTDIFKKK